MYSTAALVMPAGRFRDLAELFWGYITRWPEEQKVRNSGNRKWFANKKAHSSFRQPGQLSPSADIGSCNLERIAVFRTQGRFCRGRCRCLSPMLQSRSCELFNHSETFCLPKAGEGGTEKSFAHVMSLHVSICRFHLSFLPIWHLSRILAWGAKRLLG